MEVVATVGDTTATQSTTGAPIIGVIAEEDTEGEATEEDMEEEDVDLTIITTGPLTTDMEDEATGAEATAEDTGEGMGTIADPTTTTAGISLLIITTEAISRLTTTMAGISRLIITTTTEEDPIAAAWAEEDKRSISATWASRFRLHLTVSPTGMEKVDVPAVARIMSERLDELMRERLVNNQWSYIFGVLLVVYIIRCKYIVDDGTNK